MFLFQASDAEPGDEEQETKRNRVAAMAFKRLFPGLPAHVKEEWQRVNKSVKRVEVTQWLMSRMRKVEGKWTFVLDNSSIEKSRQRQGLVNVPFWGYWTSPLNGNYR